MHRVVTLFSFKFYAILMENVSTCLLAYKVPDSDMQDVKKCKINGHICIALTVKHTKRKAAWFSQMFDMVDFCIIILSFFYYFDDMLLILGTFPLFYWR